MCKIFQTGCPKTKKTHFFTIKPPRVLKIALTRSILVTDKCLHLIFLVSLYTCLTYPNHVQNISDTVSKNKKTHLFTIEHPRVLKIALTSSILVADKCFTPHFSCLTLYLLNISKSSAKYFRHGVQKPKKHTCLL